MTWFRLGGRAQFLFRPTDIADLSRFLRASYAEGVPVKVLGSGANVLVGDDGFDGAVIRLDGEAFKSVRDCGDGIFEVGAGVDLMPFSRAMSREGWSGLECMAGIPATIGGAIRMNAGGKFGEFGDVVIDATVLRPDGVEERWSAKRLDLGYRHSALDDGIVVNARIALSAVDPAESDARYQEYFAFKENTQPLKYHSAGCIFKNPEQMPAGALIDQTGLKGLRVGGAMISDVHANFIVTEASARATDVIALIDAVREKVYAASGTRLETEVDIW
ncbi:MAG: UDP-N-acetylmuramate dehydrogenase [Planctomycetota bacterium]|jgi:UDP-N-acetylmuramate dehydrogenase